MASINVDTGYVSRPVVKPYASFDEKDDYSNAVWSVKNSSESSRTLTQVGGNIDRAPSALFRITEVADVYRNMGVAASNKLVSTKGVRVNYSLTAMWKVSDTGSSDCCCNDGKYIPITTSVTLTIPRAFPLTDVDSASSSTMAQLLTEHLVKVLGNAADHLPIQLYGILDPSSDPNGGPA